MEQNHQALFMGTLDVFISSVDTFFREKNIPSGLVRSNFCPVLGVDSSFHLPIFVGGFSEGVGPACAVRGLCFFVVVTQHVFI